MVRFGSQDLFWYVMEWSGFVWLGNAVKVRCCRYGIGAYCLGTAGNLQRCGGDGTHVECLGSRGGDRTGTDGWGLKRSGKVRQSRSLTDRTGAVWRGGLWSGRKFAEDRTGVIWYGKMGYGSLGQERFRLARLGWAGLHWNGSVWIGKLGIEMATQEVCNGEMRYETDGTGEVWQSRRGRLR
jgi:hypothetical protein